MNKQQRTEIKALIGSNELNLTSPLELLRQSIADGDRVDWDGIKSEMIDFANAAELFAADIEAIQEAEQEKYDNMPESIQSGEKGEAFTAVIEALEAARDAATEAGGALAVAVEDGDDPAEVYDSAIQQGLDSLQEAIDSLDEAVSN